KLRRNANAGSYGVAMWSAKCVDIGKRSTFVIKRDKICCNSELNSPRAVRMQSLRHSTIALITYCIFFIYTFFRDLPIRYLLFRKINGRIADERNYYRALRATCLDM